jgi:hypothetical protein
MSESRVSEAREIPVTPEKQNKKSKKKQKKTNKHTHTTYTHTMKTKKNIVASSVESEIHRKQLCLCSLHVIMTIYQMLDGLSATADAALTTLPTCTT